MRGRSRTLTGYVGVEDGRREDRVGDEGNLGCLGEIQGGREILDGGKGRVTSSPSQWENKES